LFEGGNGLLGANGLVKRCAALDVNLTERFFLRELHRLPFHQLQDRQEEAEDGPPAPLAFE
jgi:hypothetical protein